MQNLVLKIVLILVHRRVSTHYAKTARHYIEYNVACYLNTAIYRVSFVMEYYRYIMTRCECIYKRLIII